MDIISSILDGLDNAGKIVPDLDKLLGGIHRWVSIFLMIAPLCMLILGLSYLFLPPKEANHHVGYRTYFGMGSVKAWLFTQRISGIIMTVTGLILTIIAYSAVKKFADMDLMAMGEKAFGLIKTQVICALVIYVFMFLLTAVLFDRKGNPRFGKQSRKAISRENLPAQEEQALEEPQEEEVPVVEYEKQGEQVITAEDIVNEGLD